MDLDIDMGIELIQKAYEKQVDERLFNMWNLERLFMDKNNFISFQEYKNKSIKQAEQPVKPKMTKEKIFAQADKIIAAWKKEGGTHGTV